MIQVTLQQAWMLIAIWTLVPFAFGFVWGRWGPGGPRATATPSQESQEPLRRIAEACGLEGGPYTFDIRLHKGWVQSATLSNAAGVSISWDTRSWGSGDHVPALEQIRPDAFDRRAHVLRAIWEHLLEGEADDPV